MTLTPITSDLGARLADALGAIQRAQGPFVATPAATRLELDLASALAADPDSGHQRIASLEGETIAPRAVVPAPTDRTNSPIRYFLDGVQRTFPLGWCGMSTLALAVVVVGVVERRPQDGVFHAVHGLTEVSAQIVIAAAPGEEAGPALADAFRDAGLDVSECAADASGRAGDYLALQGCLRPAVNSFRDRCERRVYRRWQERDADPAAWLIVDGQLDTGDARNTLGLIKQHSRFDLTGDEMIALLALPQGSRSTAFRRVVSRVTPPTTWYVRLHDGDGVNPLFGLARIEAPAAVETTAQIDLLTRYVYAERTPRATADTRWPTLLYPIYLAERILKTKLDRATLGVPAALRRYLREAA